MNMSSSTHPSITPSNLMIGNGLMNYDFNAGNGNPAYDLFVDKLDGLLSLSYPSNQDRLLSTNKKSLFRCVFSIPLKSPFKVSAWSIWWPLRRQTATLKSLRSSRYYWPIWTVEVVTTCNVYKGNALENLILHLQTFPSSHSSPNLILLKNFSKEFHRHVILAIYTYVYKVDALENLIQLRDRLVQVWISVLSLMLIYLSLSLRTSLLVQFPPVWTLTKILNTGWKMAACESIPWTTGWLDHLIIIAMRIVYHWLSTIGI